MARADTLRSEGNYDEADSVEQAARRISDRMEVLRVHRFEERRELQNAEVPSLPH